MADIGRAGLGNLLLPWARAEIFRHRYGLAMLAPQWTTWKIGPLLRREKDLRYYTDLFSNRGYIRFLKRWQLTCQAQRIDEAQAKAMIQADSATCSGKGTKLFVFQGLADFYESLASDRGLLSRRLIEMLRPAMRQALEQWSVAPELAPLFSGRQWPSLESDFLADFSSGNPFEATRMFADGFIAAHVRRGDKPPIPLGQTSSDWNKAMPDLWFIRLIEQIRQMAGQTMPVVVFSDGRPEQIQQILSLPKVYLAPPRASIVDILAMARCRVLLGTTGSSFSMWSAFLGRMPNIWYPLQRRTVINRDDPQGQLETDSQGYLSDSATKWLTQHLLRSGQPAAMAAGAGGGV